MAKPAIAQDNAPVRPLPRPPDPLSLIRPPARPVAEATAPVLVPPSASAPAGPAAPAAISAEPATQDAPDLALLRPPPRPARTPFVNLAEWSRPPARPASLVIRRTLPPPSSTAIAMPDKPRPPGPPPKPKPTPAKPTPTAMRNVDIVMVGDSLTAGGHWDSRFPGVRIANRGVSGDTALKILARMDGILATRPKRALLMFGINDIYNGVPVERIYRRYDRIVTILLSRNIEVVIQSTLACTGAVCGEKLGKVHALNTRLRAMARARGLKFVDINRGLSDRGGLKSSFSRDGVHLNGTGYGLWYASLKPYLRRS